MNHDLHSYMHQLEYARVMPPFLPLAESNRSLVIQRYRAVEDAASGATSMVH